MFSLIISIISIALVAALAAATVYFGGSAFNKGTADAASSEFINAGQQVNGAFTIASTDATFTGTSVADLAPKYLAQVPTFNNVALALDTTKTAYVSASVKKDVCDSINKKAGLDSAGATYVADSVAKLAANPLFVCDATVGSEKAYYKVK